MTAIWRKARRFIVHNVLHADDTPHRIALGIAVGLFIGLTPTVGFQMVLAVAIAAALRANKVVCIPMVWITNPFTIIPIYAACARLGGALVGSRGGAEGVAGVRQIQRFVAETWALGFDRVLELEFWTELFARLTRLTVELWIGCILVAALTAALGYFGARWGVSAYREQRTRHLAERLRRREARRLAKQMPARRRTA